MNNAMTLEPRIYPQSGGKGLITGEKKNKGQGKGGWKGPWRMGQCSDLDSVLINYVLCLYTTYVIREKRTKDRIREVGRVRGGWGVEQCSDLDSWLIIDALCLYMT